MLRHAGPPASSPGLRGRLSLLMFLQYAPTGALVPLFTLRLQELDFTPLEMGWACATQALASLTAPLVAGQIADRWWPTERLIAVCGLLAGILLWVLASLTGFLGVFAASLAFWLVMAPVWMLGVSLSFTHLAAPARDFGGVRMWGTVGWVSGGWLAALWLRWLRPPGLSEGVADAFRVGGVLAFALSLYALTLPHTPPQRSRSAPLAPLAALRVLRSRAFVVYWVCILGLCVTFPFYSQVTPLLLNFHGVAPALVGPTMTISQSMEIVSLALLPMLMLRLGVRGTMRLGITAWAVLLTVLALGEPLGLVISSLAMNGLCVCCFLVAGQLFVNSRAHPDVRASAQALLTCTTGLGLLAGNLLVGGVRQAVHEEFRPTFLAGAAVATVMVIVFLFGFPADDK